MLALDKFKNSCPLLTIKIKSKLIVVVLVEGYIIDKRADALRIGALFRII